MSTDTTSLDLPSVHESNQQFAPGHELGSKFAYNRAGVLDARDRTEEVRHSLLNHEVCVTR